MAESSDKTWSAGEGNGKPLQYSYFENPHEQYDKAKRTLKDELPRLVDAYFATGDQWRNSSRRNEEAEPKWKQSSVMEVSGGASKFQCCKEQNCIGTWSVTS